MQERKCLECGTVLKGRSDKKFCSDYCRNTYNNKVNRDSKKSHPERQQPPEEELQDPLGAQSNRQNQSQKKEPASKEL